MLDLPQRHCLGNPVAQVIQGATGIIALITVMLNTGGYHNTWSARSVYERRRLSLTVVAVRDHRSLQQTTYTLKASHYVPKLRYRCHIFSEFRRGLSQALAFTGLFSDEDAIERLACFRLLTFDPYGVVFQCR